MSSWLGGLGSGLGQSLGQVGGSLSSFTGQISTFTKDMLLEGVEEVGDAATELQVSNSKLTQVEMAFTAQRSEHERLKKLHVELEEKLEASEIQNKQQSTEYRNQLQQRDVEISHLKARQSGLQDEIQALQHSSHVAMLPLTTTTSSSTVPTTTSSSSSSSFMPHTVGGHHGFHGDEMDLSDVMWSQQEINRLATEVARLEAELSHWRRVAQASNSTGSGNGDHRDGLQLQRTIEDLREQMSREVDEHQHEMAALQDAQRHKMADFSRRHREELAEYEERIEELEEQLHTGERSQPASPTSTSQPDVQSTSLQRDTRLEELRASLEEAQSSRGLLQKEREEAQEENTELLQNYSRLQASVAELQARVQEQEDKAVHRAQMESEIQGLRKALAGAEQELERLQSLPEAEPREEVEHADILELNTVIGSLREEKERLEQDKRSLQASLEESEARGAGGGGGGGPGESLGLEELQELQEELGRRAKQLLEAQEERETLLAELEELDGQNQEATQHMISVKEQLSGQLQESQDQVSRLTSDLTALQEKLSQSAFTLNDLHMSKRTLEDTVKELRSSLGRAQEQVKEARSESSELRRSLQEKEDERLDRTGDQGGEGVGERVEQEDRLRAELLEREKELAELRGELGAARRSREEALSENYEMKMRLEKRRLQEKKEEEEEQQQQQEEVGKVGELSRQLRDSRAVLSRTVLEKDTRIEALKLEKSQLEGELSRAEGSLAGQARRHQQTMEELTRARSLDATALQAEHERAVRLNQDKEQEIAQLRRDVEQMAADHRDTNEMLSITVAGQEQLTDLLQEKDSFMDTLKQNATELQRELEAKVEEVSQEAQGLRQALEERDRHLGVMKEDNSHLREEIDRLRDQQSRPQPHTEPRTLDIITELETEIHQLKASRDLLEDETHTLRRTTEEQQASLLLAQQSLLAQQGELEQAHARQEQTLQNYNRLLHARDEEVARLQQAVDGLGGPPPPPPAPQVQGEVILHQDKDNQSLNGGESGNEKHDLSKVEIQRLVQGIQEKESEIHQLSERNVSLARQLDQLALSRDEAGKLAQMVRQKDLEIQALHARVTTGQDVLYLQQQLQAYALEREQVLSVLNEKTRENSQLRSDYHRLMDIVSGKEAALLKVQQENTRLANMSDPSGSQEMFRETIQNLSRIIREKDIEIDALTQKCQTLVAVLQASAGPEPGGGGGGGSWGGGGGVSSNQFEELLQERDTLKQQVKKVEEWKLQVITTVKNLQHESAQMHEELLKLQGKVSADSDCSSQLSVDYAHLIQSYELKERRLGSLGQELAQVQQTISQLSSTKDVLLGKLDSVVPEVAGQLVQAGDALLSMEALGPVQQGGAPAPPAPSDGGLLQQLQAEVRSLRALVAERDAAVRTLQESNLRLSASEGEQQQQRRRGRAQAEEEEAAEEAAAARHARERLETLQRSSREKDLLIKAKGDQLAQASEALRNRESDSEVLKQAVTNLKERALILELDGRALKEENEAVASRSREKESEFRALQETNMQVSFLLREKEFQLTSMSEKAATLEKMLKDKDQGNSGELNQLLNEMRSMQEKAVLFQQERDQVMLALKQKQMETTAVHTELQRVKDKEARLNVELERLRSHLLEMEDSYTRDALAAEDREVELRRRVALLDQRLASSSSAVENASLQAGLQVESLQEQLGAAVRQRDEALMKLHTSQEQVKQYAQSLSNLQIVLEQFQQEEKSMYSSELDKLRREKEAQRSRAERLEDQASALQMNLDEANSALESASRLTDQLDLNEEQMEDLRKQVALRQEMLEEAQTKLMELLNSTEGKVDKLLMRNLFLGYFHTPRNKRGEVLRLMGNVLGLSREVVDKMLEEDGRPGVTGWVSSWLGGRGPHSVPNTPPRPGAGQSLNSSFSEMFVKFLEVESSTDRPPPRMPVQDMKALGAPPPGRGPGSSSSGLAKRPLDSNPFLAPRSAAVPLLGAGVPGGSGGAGGGHLLMKPISEALPSFTPVPVCSEASGLKDLLRQ